MNGNKPFFLDFNIENCNTIEDLMKQSDEYDNEFLIGEHRNQIVRLINYGPSSEECKLVSSEYKSLLPYTFNIYEDV